METSRSPQEHGQIQNTRVLMLFAMVRVPAMLHALWMPLIAYAPVQVRAALDPIANRSFANTGTASGHPLS